MKWNEKSLQKLQNYIKRGNIQDIGVQEGFEDAKGVEIILRDKNRKFTPKIQLFKYKKVKGHR